MANKITPRISISELYELKNKNVSNRKHHFDIVLEMTHKRMRNAATYGGLNVFFEVPPFVLGIPLYNFTDCINYIVDSLRNNGFLVQLIEPDKGIMYISWDQQEIAPKKLIGKPKPENYANPHASSSQNIADAFVQLGRQSEQIQSYHKKNVGVTPPKNDINIRRYML